MQTSPKQPRQEQRARLSLGFHTPSEDPRDDPNLLAAVSRIAPGTDLRQGLDDIIRAGEGALIVMSDPDELSFLFSGGINLDQPFTPQLLYELAKMDGAIIVTPDLSKVAVANVQLMPDPTIPSNETGTRHRTAERVAKQTGALVLSISQQRKTVTLFLGEHRYQLESIAEVLAKTNQALQTLETYRTRLDQVMTRLTALEFQNAVMLEDVLIVVQRAEMTMRMGDEIERDCIELGSEGRLIGLQLGELISDVPDETARVVYDYHASDELATARKALAKLHAMPYQALLVYELIAERLGYPGNVNPSDHPVAPRGYRVLSQIPRLSEAIVHKVVAGLGGLDAILRASHRELEQVAGVGPARARDIREGLRRLQEHNLVDRYLQL
jgi:diadenylate cyclase